MQQIIDVAHNVGPFARRLADLGVTAVIRYYNIANSRALPSKCLSARELGELHAAGLSVAVVFEAGGGAKGRIGDLSTANAARDARRALQLAASLDQPSGSGLYFAVDHDFVNPRDLAQIEVYFSKVKADIGGGYRLGVYGSGTVARRLQAEGLVDLIWLAGATGWSGTRRALRDGVWTLFQKDLDQALPFGGLDCDGNVFNAAFEDFGQFTSGAAAQTPRGVGSAAIFFVTARSGLNLRAGPGEAFAVIRSVGQGTLVRGLKREGGWIQVDTEGDGQADGFMHASYLKPESGGLPLAPTAPSSASQPIDIARAELALGVQEVPGAASNPRIVMYHATTKGGAAADEVAWCSSFVNYCVEQCGLTSTESKAARSWHDQAWGTDVTAQPEVGDIVVFSRTNATTHGGHVGFFLGATADAISCLGGNQGDRVSISTYPKNGVKGPFTYKLLSIRRG